MKKISFLSLFFAVMAATVVWAQDEAPKQSRNLSFYMDATSGHLAPGIVTKDGGAVDKTNQLFQGSELEWGMRYSQSFKNAPMVSMGGSVIVVMNYNPTYDANGSFVGHNVFGPASLGNLKANVWVAVPYFTFLLDARGLMGTYLNYRKSFGKAGSIAVGTDLEFFFTGSPFYSVNGGSFNVGGTQALSPIYIVDYFGIWLSYAVPLGKGFSYATALQFRLDAGRGGVNGGVEADPASNFNIRWNNTFSYSYDGWNFYTQFRLEAINIAKSTQTTRDPNARFRIIAGMSYTFDLAIAK